MYLLGKKLFGTWIGAFAASFLLTFDFMHFTMARLGTADTYVVFFSLLSQLCFLFYFTNVLKNGWKTSVLPLFFAVVFFALGFSTKWIVLYGAVGMLMMLAALRIKDITKLKDSIVAKYAAFFDHPFLLLLGFIGVAIVIYFATYIPDMLAKPVGRPILGTYGNGIIDLQGAMFNYHATLTAPHDFYSVWWSWPFLVSNHGWVPLWLWVNDLPNAMRSTISVLGNPAVWWVGFASIIAITIETLKADEIARFLRTRIAKIASRLRARLTKKPQSNENVQNPQGEFSAENINQETEAKQHFKNLVTAALGVLIFTLTAIIAGYYNYRSFYLALPLYLGMFIATYGFVAHLKDQPDSKEVAAVFIMSLFFFSWIPYVFLSRGTFIYHFYVSVPFLCLATAYFINKYWNKKLGKVAAVVIFAAVVILFVVFYPVISGVPAEKSYIENLRWFGSWYW